MFSSTDTPNRRAIFIYLVTQDEAISVDCPRELAREFVQLLSYPRQKQLDDFAKKLAQYSWVDYGIVAGYVRQEIDDGNPKEVDGDDVWKQALEVEADQTIDSVRLVGIDAERFNHLPTRKPLKLSQLRVEIWKFVHKHNEVKLEELIETVVVP